MPTMSTGIPYFTSGTNTNIAVISNTFEIDSPKYKPVIHINAEIIANAFNNMFLPLR